MGTWSILRLKILHKKKRTALMYICVVVVYLSSSTPMGKCWYCLNYIWMHLCLYVFMYTHLRIYIILNVYRENQRTVYMYINVLPCTILHCIRIIIFCIVLWTAYKHFIFCRFLLDTIQGKILYIARSDFLKLCMWAVMVFYFSAF